MELGWGGGGDMAGSDWDSKMASHLFGIALAMLKRNEGW